MILLFWDMGTSNDSKATDYCENMGFCALVMYIRFFYKIYFLHNNHKIDVNPFCSEIKLYDLIITLCYSIQHFSIEIIFSFTGIPDCHTVGL